MTNTETSGGTRFSEGKPGMWWAVPMMGLRLIAKVTEAGARKYAPRDWAEGQSFSTLIDCAMRHMIEVCHRGPWAIDEDTGAYHAAAVGWNILCLLTFMELERHDLDDVTKWHGVTTAMKQELETEPQPPFVETSPFMFRDAEGREVIPTWDDREQEVAWSTADVIVSRCPANGPCPTPGCDCHLGLDA